MKHANTKHGHASAGRVTSTYKTWAAMVARCTNPNVDAYRYYGARGVTVCDRWHAFAAFLEDMGARPAGTTLDRIDNSGNYEPGNCRWATQEEQNRNRKRVRLFECNGRSLTVTEWAKELGLSRKTIWTRIYKGWAVAAALGLEAR